MMDEEYLRAVAARDQFWATLRTLLPEIERLADGEFGDEEISRKVAQLLARTALAELQFQAEERDRS